VQVRTRWTLPALGSRCNMDISGSTPGCAGLVGTGSKVADSLASVIPESVPRSVAKAGVVGIVGILGFWLVQKVRALEMPAREY
jgi:hypothetical protein